MVRLGSALRRATAIHAKETATVFGERTQTWTVFADRVARLANALIALDTNRGDRVAVLAHNSDRYLEAMLAVPWAGAIIVPVNTRLAPPEILHWLQDSAARIWLVDHEFAGIAQELASELPDVEHYVALDMDPPAGWHSYEKLIASAGPACEVDGSPDEPIGIFYTGGTTGRSKGVTLSHRNVLASATQTLVHIGWNHTSNYLHAAPMFHLADGLGTFATLLLGARQTFVPRFSPPAALDAIEQHRVTCTILVPTMIGLLVNEPTAPTRNLECLTSLVYGGSPIPEAVMTRAATVLPQTRLWQLYGQSEASPTLTVLDPEYHVFDGPLAGKTRSAGRPVIGCEITILDQADQPVPPGKVGQIAAKGDNVMLGYWNQPQTTAAALAGGWLHTGDAGYLDTEGFLFVVDRIKDMIVTGGENVYSAEVENAIMAHPSVAQAVVIGIPSQQWGEQVHAILHLHSGHSVTEAEIIAHCHQHIANYKCPKSVEIRPDPLSVSGAGKYLKSLIREPYWQGAAPHTLG